MMYSKGKDVSKSEDEDEKCLSHTLCDCHTL